MENKLNARELRVGNLIYKYGLPIEVTPVIIQALQNIELAGKICIDLSPIPLTEDELVKLGFRWNEEFKAYESPEYLGYQVFGIHKGINVGFQNWEVYNLIIKAVVNSKIKYVHQLQNLYYALTGKELTYKNQTQD